jgi:hypothetical protein
MHHDASARQAVGRALLIGVSAFMALAVAGACAWAFAVPAQDHRNLRYLMWTIGRHAFLPAFAQAFAADPARERLVIGADLAALDRLFPSVGVPIDKLVLKSLGLPVPTAAVEERWLTDGWVEMRGGRVTRLYRPSIFHC